MWGGCCRTSVGVIGKRPNQPRVAAMPDSLAPVQCARTPPVCQVTPHSTCRPVECGCGLVVARASGKNSHSGNRGPCVRPSGRPPGAGSGQGVGVSAVRAGWCEWRVGDAVGSRSRRLWRAGRAGSPREGPKRLLRTPGAHARRGRGTAYAREGAWPVRASHEGGGGRRVGVRQPTHHLEVSCEASPQISAPALVRTHQRQLTGTCKLFGMPRNRNTQASRLVVIT